VKWIRNNTPIEFISQEELKMARYAELRDEIPKEGDCGYTTLDKIFGIIENASKVDEKQ
jgi:hypothetical protein